MKILLQSICTVFFSCLVLLGSSRCLYAATESGFVSFDNRELLLMHDSAYISSTANGEIGETLQVDGAAASDWSASSPMWNTGSVEDGAHVLTLSNGDSASTDVLVINAADVVIHEGVLESDEVWQAGVVHVVRHWVRVPAGKRLIIPNDAVVKFCEDAGILNEGMLSAMSATFTAFADDVIGGDTNLDGDSTVPAEESYSIVNRGTLTGLNCTKKYAVAGSSISSSTVADGAFQGCEELTEVAIPGNVTIGENAFKDCAKITQITFQGTAGAEALNAFDGCHKIENVYFTNGLPQQEYSFGSSTPTIYIGAGGYPEKWSGYPVVDTFSVRQEMLKADKALSDTDTAIGDEVAQLRKELDALQELLAGGKAGQILTKNEDGTCSWQEVAVQGSEVMTISLEAGWNSVAMPGRGLLEECEKALLEQFEIYSYDKKSKAFKPSECLDSLACYWIYAKEPTTLHFSVKGSGE